MTTQGLLEAVADAVAERSPLLDEAVERVTVGDRLVMVELGDAVTGAAGVAHRPAGGLGADPSGRPALDVARWATDGAIGDDLLGRAVGIATLNALSAPLIEWRTGDPFEALVSAVSAIATVGLFGPAFRKFGAVEVRVIERGPVEPPATPEGVTVATFGPDEAAAAMADVDVAFVTGSSLLYGGTEDYLAAASEAGVADVVLVGATASFLPEPAFAAGATMLAGARVTDSASVRQRIRAGQCATDVHDHGLEKVYVTAGEARGLEFG